MAKKRKNSNYQRSAADYYELKTQAVEDLVTADNENSPAVSKAELERYGAKPKSGIPNWLKVNFIKWWFPGAVCLFMIMALNLQGLENHVLIVGIVNGMVTDLLTNNILRTMATPDGANDKWMMFAKARYINFFLNILYAMLLCLMVEFLYLGADLVLNAVMGTSGQGYLVIESVSYGLFYMLSDNLFVGIKNLVRTLFSSGKNKKVQEG